MVPFLLRGAVAVVAVFALTGCAAIGLAATEALVTAGAIGTAAVAVSTRPDSARVDVYGNFRDARGYWFDHELYGVWVVSDAPEVSELYAHSLASDACAQKGKAMGVVRKGAWQERGLFIPVRLDRFSFEMKFRCMDEAAP